jgi:hypothetical protein
MFCKNYTAIFAYYFENLERLSLAEEEAEKS